MVYWKGDRPLNRKRAGLCIRDFQEMRLSALFGRPVYGFKPLKINRRSLDMQRPAQSLTRSLNACHRVGRITVSNRSPDSFTCPRKTISMPPRLSLRTMALSQTRVSLMAYSSTDLVRGDDKFPVT